MDFPKGIAKNNEQAILIHSLLYASYAACSQLRIGCTVIFACSYVDYDFKQKLYGDQREFTSGINV